MVMSSGKRKRIVISCVTFETRKITDPILFYQATDVHLIRYVKNNEKNNIYQEFYDRVCEIIHDESPLGVEIIEHIEKVYDFTTMLRAVLKIIQKERNKSQICDIFVNISAGTAEYAAAAAVASMMIPGTIPFSVGAKEYTIGEENGLRRVFYENGKPVGLTKSARDPYIMPCYHIDIPEEHLVRGLRILHQRNEMKQPVDSTKMVLALKDSNMWLRYEIVIDREKTESEQKRSDAVYYQRDFINKWLERGWVEKDELRKRYVLTDRGMTILDTFYVD